MSMASDDSEFLAFDDGVEKVSLQPPELPKNLPEDERYWLLLTTALRGCAEYKPKFGQTKVESRFNPRPTTRLSMRWATVAYPLTECQSMLRWVFQKCDLCNTSPPLPICR
jgi:hypothetical protein